MVFFMKEEWNRNVLFYLKHLLYKITMAASTLFCFRNFTMVIMLYITIAI